jgi:hypothetical protein
LNFFYDTVLTTWYFSTLNYTTYKKGETSSVLFYLYSFSIVTYQSQINNDGSSNSHTLIGRVASLSEIYRPAASAALSVLQSRGLQYVGINQLREALIAAGYGSYVRHLGKIAEGLFWSYK